MEDVLRSQVLTLDESKKDLISTIFEKGVELEYSSFYSNSSMAICPRDGCERISYCSCDCNDGW